MYLLIRNIIPRYGAKIKKKGYFLSTNIELHDLKQYCTLHNPLNLSSHDPLTVTLKVASEEQTSVEKYSDTYSSFVRKKVLWDTSKLEAYKKATDTALTTAAM